MAIERGTHPHHEPPRFVLAPDVDERMALRAVPSEEIVASWVMTRGAERAWQSINRALAQPRGAAFFLTGPAGSGKTHFLSYVLALQERAGTIDDDTPGRQVVIALEAEPDQRPAALQSRILEALGRELGVTRRTVLLWRQMRDGDAFKVALDQARRTGIQTATLALDFQLADPRSSHPMLAQLERLADSSREPRLIVIAAGREVGSIEHGGFEIAPTDLLERRIVAVGRARRVEASIGSQVAQLYRGIETAGAAPEAIFPFHPVSLRVLTALAGPPAMVAELATLAREALAPRGAAHLFSARRLLMPADLMESEEIARRVQARLSEAERAALKIALGAAPTPTARIIVETLMLEGLTGDSPVLTRADLRGLIPGASQADPPGARQIGEIVTKLEADSGGVIRSDARGVRFDPRAAGAPEVAAFNAALALTRRFDPSLTAAEERPELAAKLKRLDDAMDSTIERASRVRDGLRSALAAVHMTMPQEDEKVLADFVALAEEGAGALIGSAADEPRREKAIAVIEAWLALEAASALLPRTGAMTAYIEATGLDSPSADDSTEDGRIAALATEAQLLLAQLNPTALLRARRPMEAIEARFQKFKWSYVQLYRTAHQRWRAEASLVAGRLDDLRRHLEALGRLDSIAGLGAPLSEALLESSRRLAAGIRLCDFEGTLNPEVQPRCPRCAYVLGARSPAADLGAALDHVRRALRKKLAALSRGAIARIIREHDQGGRLEGFLKITQAAQTEALVRVLDDDLAAYLGRLIEENAPQASAARSIAESSPSPRRVPIASARKQRRGSN